MAWGFPTAARAAVIQTPGLISVEGVINGDGSSPPGIRGDTLDYLKFEVLTTSSITVTSGFGNNGRLLLAQFIGRDDEFGFLDHPFILEQNSSTQWDSFTRILEPGTYVTAMGVRTRTQLRHFRRVCGGQSRGWRVHLRKLCLFHRRRRAGLGILGRRTGRHFHRYQHSRAQCGRPARDCCTSMLATQSPQPE